MLFLKTVPTYCFLYKLLEDETVSSREDKTFDGMCLIPGHHVKSYKKMLNRALCGNFLAEYSGHFLQKTQHSPLTTDFNVFFFLDSLETKLENLSAKQQRLQKKTTQT